MSNEVFEQWMNFSKDAAEPIMKLNELSAKAMEKVARQQLDMAKDYMDLGTQQMQLMGQAKNPADWMTAQGELVADFNKKLMGRAEAFMAIANETQQNMAEWTQETSQKAKPAK